MADLDPATLEKFQRFQAMLAASPEIVEALNSPEILALAAKTAAEKKQQGHLATSTPTPQQPPPPPPPPAEPHPEYQYPMVGHGVSDDVSVLSEMTTPTVVTRHTVEEDEFYPEVDGGTGQSSSGLPRRLGVRSIGVSSTGNGNLPPPPPKPKNALNRHNARMARKAKASLARPMSKIVESQDNSTVDLDATSGSAESKSDDSKDNSRKGTSWSPKMRKSEKKIEAHPFFGSVGVGAVSRQARSGTYNNRARRTKGRERGVNRNRSMPTNIKNLGSVSSSITGSSDSLWDEDDPSKSSSEFLSTGSNTSTAVESNATPVQRTTMQVKSKASMSPPRPNSRKSFPRGVARNRSMPMPTKNSSTGSTSTSDSPFKVIGSVGGSSRNYSDDDDDNDNESHTRTSIDFDEEDEEVPLAKSTDEIPATPMAKDGRGSFQNAPNSRGKSVPRMRLVPVVAKSVTSAESSPAKIMTRTPVPLKKPRSRSLSKYSNSSRSASVSGSEDDDDLDNRSRASAPANAEERRRPRSSKVLRQRSSSSDPKKARSRSLSKYSNSGRSASVSASEDDDDLDNRSRASAPANAEERIRPRSSKVLRQRSSSSDPKKARSRSLSKYSISSRSGSEENDDDDDVNNQSFSSAPAIPHPEERRRPRSSKILRHGSSSSDPKKPRSRSLSKYSNSSRRDSISGSSEDDDDLDNRSRASAPVTASSDQKSVSASLKKYSYRVSTDEDDGDDGSPPPIPLRNSYGDDAKNNDSKNRSFSSFLDESDEINSQVSDNASDDSSTSSEEQERPAVTRRWKPPPADNSSLPPAFRSTTSNNSQKMAAKKSPKPAFRKVSTSSNSNKTSSSEEQKETRTETPSSDSDSDDEPYVRQTVRKPGKPRTKSKSPPPGKFPEKFEDHLFELNQVIQADFRPGDYLTGAESSFAATRKKRDQNKKKKNLGKESTAAARSGDWLGGGATTKRTWKAKAVKEIKS